MASAVQVKQLGKHLHFRQEWEFNTFGLSRFESLLAHVGPEWLLATVEGIDQIIDLQKVGQGH